MEMRAGIQNLATTPIGVPRMLREVPRWLTDPLGPLHIQPCYLTRALHWLLRFARETTERRARHELNRNSVTNTVELARWAGSSICSSFGPVILVPEQERLRTG
jgi:D-amino-acid dehydrogenase